MTIITQIKELKYDTLDKMFCRVVLSKPKQAEWSLAVKSKELELLLPIPSNKEVKVYIDENGFARVTCTMALSEAVLNDKDLNELLTCGCVTLIEGD